MIEKIPGETVASYRRRLAAFKATPAGRKVAKSLAATRSTTAKAGGAPRTKRKGKYNSSGRHVDGIWFASAAEAERYAQLKELLERGEIEDLECQAPYELRVNNHVICKYRADFRYKVIDDRGYILREPVEDVKGMETDVFKIKRKLLLACHGVQLVEIPARKVKDWRGKVA